MCWGLNHFISVMTYPLTKSSASAVGFFALCFLLFSSVSQPVAFAQTGCLDVDSDGICDDVDNCFDLDACNYLDASNLAPTRCRNTTWTVMVMVLVIRFAVCGTVWPDQSSCGVCFYKQRRLQ